MTGQYLQVAGGGYSQLEPEWVDEVLLAGAPIMIDETCQLVPDTPAR